MGFLLHKLAAHNSHTNYYFLNVRFHLESRGTSQQWSLDFRSAQVPKSGGGQSQLRREGRTMPTRRWSFVGSSQRSSRNC